MTLRVTVDRAGRLVLPKAVREHLGLEAGSEVELTVTAESIRLDPVRNDSNLICENGLMVHVGQLVRDLSTFDEVRADREARMRRAAGLETSGQ